jgi:hypothetical protein
MPRRVSRSAERARRMGVRAWKLDAGTVVVDVVRKMRTGGRRQRTELGAQRDRSPRRPDRQHEADRNQGAQRKQSQRQCGYQPPAGKVHEPPPDHGRRIVG